MVLLTAAAILAIMFGMIWSTDRIDNHWKTKKQPTVPITRLPRPFRYSQTQCVDCGTDGDLLDLQTHQCFTCFEHTQGATNG